MAKPNQTTKTAKNEKSTRSLWSWQTILPLVGVVILLLIANSALWVNNTLFNTEAFTNTTSQALLSESSRDAIGGEVVDRALVGRPVAKRLVEEPATKLVSGLLGTNLAQTAVTKVVARLQTTVTTAHPENIEFDLTGIKSTIAKLLTATGNEEKLPDEPVLPDKLILLDRSALPNLHAYGTVFLWLAPLAVISAALLLALPHLLRRSVDLSIMALQGGVLIATGVLAQLVGPLFRPLVVGQVSSANLRVVVENIYNAFINTFNHQSYWLFWLGGLLVLVPVSVYVYTNLVGPRLVARKS